MKFWSVWFEQNSSWSGQFQDLPALPPVKFRRSKPAVCLSKESGSSLGCEQFFSTFIHGRQQSEKMCRHLSVAAGQLVCIRCSLQLAVYVYILYLNIEVFGAVVRMYCNT